MMRRALVGHTGFVGSNLRDAGAYTDLYNSSNVGEMAGGEYDEIVCAGISAVKWLANQEPEQDWAGIRVLLDALAGATAKRFVLISTVDVYPEPDQPLTEDAVLDGIPNHAYGRHRLAVERWVAERFPDHLITRLPALFGPHLKKNALFDLLHGNEIHKINPAGVFQWYPVRRLSEDIGRASAAGLRLVNLVTPPLPMSDIIDDLFPGAAVGPSVRPAPVYDLRTRHAAAFGGPEGWVMEAGAVKAALRSYVAGMRGSSAA